MHSVCTPAEGLSSRCVTKSPQHSRAQCGEWQCTPKAFLHPAPHPSAQPTDFSAALAAPFSERTCSASRSPGHALAWQLCYFKVPSVIAKHTFQMQGFNSIMVPNVWTRMRGYMPVLAGVYCCMLHYIFLYPIDAHIFIFALHIHTQIRNAFKMYTYLSDVQNMPGIC